MHRRKFLQYLMISSGALAVAPGTILEIYGRKQFYLVFGRDDGIEPFRIPLTPAQAEKFRAIPRQRLRDLNMSHMYVATEYI